MRSAGLFSLSLLVVACGCGSMGRKDLVATHALDVETRPTPQAQFSTPTVYLENHVLEVSGTVHVTTPLLDDGRHIHLDLFSRDVEELDLVEAELKPNPDNPKDPHSASYLVRYFYNPPVPVTLMVVSLAEAQCWNTQEGDSKGGVLAGYGQGGAKIKSIGSKAQRPEYLQKSTPAKPLGYKSPGYHSGRSGGSRHH
jgi:hypothetical protein